MGSQPLTWKVLEVEIPTERARELAYWLSRDFGPLDKFGDRRDQAMTVRFAAARTDGVMHAYVTYTVIGGWASDLWRAFERMGGPEFDSSSGRIREVARLDLESLDAALPRTEYAQQSDLLWNRFTYFVAGLRSSAHAYENGWVPEGLDDVPHGFERRDSFNGAEWKVSFSRTDLVQDGWVWMRAFEWTAQETDQFGRRWGTGQRVRPDGLPTGFWMSLIHDQQTADRERFTWEELEGRSLALARLHTA